MYKYTALNNKGEKVKGILEASTPTELKYLLKKQNLVLLKYSKSIKSNFEIKIFERIKTKDISVFTRELSTMINAGVGLLRALEILEGQIEKTKLKVVISQIKKDISVGISLASALNKHPKYFNKLYVSMVKAGEASGMLDVVLERVAKSLENSEEIKGKIRSAMIYPLIVLLTALLVMFFMLAFIIPKFMLLFQGTGVEMPLLTRLVMKASNIASTYWYLFLIVGILIVYILKLILKSSQGKRKIDILILKIPIIKTFIRKTEMARFTRTLSTLLNSGVEILLAFDISREIVGNTIIGEAITKSKISIRDGASIYKPLEESGQFPLIVTDMIQVGEESGRLNEVLEKVANFTEMELEEAVRNLLAAFEPLIILVMAVGVGILIIAMFLPLFKMSDMVG